MQATPVNVEGIYSFQDNLKISHAVSTGNTVYVSGQIALDPDGNVVGEGDVEAQGDYIWGNIQKVLWAAGASMDDVVKVFQFVVGRENFAGMAMSRRKVLGDEPFRATTAIVVAGLMRPELLLEVDVIAVIGEKKYQAGENKERFGHWRSIKTEGIYSYPSHLKIAHSVRVGNTVHISGQTARRPDGTVAGKGDVEVQADLMWDNIEKVLADAGATIDDIVKVFQFVVGADNFAGMTRARRRALGEERLRAVTSLVVSGLAQPDLLLEIDVIAVVGD